VIREDGFVRSLNVTYEAMDNGREIDAQYTFTYTNVGTATVTPPEWADEAYADASVELRDVDVSEVRQCPSGSLVLVAGWLVVRAEPLEHLER
jgi:hypothetical protein